MTATKRSTKKKRKAPPAALPFLREAERTLGAAERLLRSAVQPGGTPGPEWEYEGNEAVDLVLNMVWYERRAIRGVIKNLERGDD